MIEIDDKIISDQVIEEFFICDLEKCKGGCCVEGDAGAPISQEEADLIKEYYPIIKKYLSPEAIDLIEKEGTHTFDQEHDLVTPTINDGICAYGYYDDAGIVKCGIEKAYREGEIDFKKPITCHLFPIITTKTETMELVNYYPRKSLCRPACKLGKSLKVPVYQFLKEPLIRKYGTAFYEALEAAAQYKKENIED